jgi:hypothetical protein
LDSDAEPFAADGTVRDSRHKISQRSRRPDHDDRACGGGHRVAIFHSIQDRRATSSTSMRAASISFSNYLAEQPRLRE